MSSKVDEAKISDCRRSRGATDETELNTADDARRVDGFAWR
jgi:hypothetical protein